MPTPKGPGHGAVSKGEPSKCPGELRKLLGPSDGSHGTNGVFCLLHLGGGNSNIFYFHPETWGR